jgi:hypothetical protein
MEVDRIDKQFDDCIAFLLRVNFYSLIKKVLTVCYVTVKVWIKLITNSQHPFSKHKYMHK